MNIHTPSVIDRAELAKRVHSARQEKGLTQEEVANRSNRDDISKTFISSVEHGNYAFKSEESLPRVKALCDCLGVEIPWVAAETKKRRALVTVPQTEPEFSKIEDGEVTAIYICNRALGRLSDQKSIKRVLAYFMERYLEDSRP
jgi:transcriptional regulator with XRE-family HTH domain